MKAISRRSAAWGGYLALSLLLLAGAALAASLSRFLPASGTIPGWKVVANSSRGGSDNDTLYEIYNGAVDSMREAGLAEAYQRQYSRGNDRLTVDLFRFRTWQQAKAYYTDQRNANRSAGLVKIYADLPREAFIAENAGMIAGMGWGKTYVLQIGLVGSGNAKRYEAYKFLKNILRKIDNS